MKQTIPKYGHKSRQSGWHNESVRHSLASKGIKTGTSEQNMLIGLIGLQKKEADYAKEKGLGRVGYKSVFTYKIGDVPIKANIRFKNLSSEDVLPIPKIIMRDSKGLEVIYTRVDQSGKPLEKTNYVFMNSKGEIVPRNAIKYYSIDDKGKEKSVNKFESNVGGNKTIPTIKMISRDEGEKFLVEKVYEMVGETEEDDKLLFRVSQDLIKNDELAVVPIVLTKSFKKYFGLVTPVRIGKDKFSMLVRLGRTKIIPQQPMTIKLKETVKKELPTLKVEVPF